MNCCQKSEKENKSSCCAPKKKLNKNLVVSLLIILPALMSFFMPFLVPYREAVFSYISSIYWAILLGFILGGVIEYYVPKQYVSNVMAGSKGKTILNAVSLGFVMTFCCHGILALAIQLYKKGASTASVVAFLMASPWSNISITILLISLFGFYKALYIIISALIIALITGYIFQILEKKRWVESNQNTLAYDVNLSIISDIKERVKAHKFGKADFKGIFSGAISLADMTLWWILIGIGLASLLGAYIPAHLFHKFMGPSFTGMLVTLAVATVIEVCSEGTAPLAFEIFRQTGALGNSFVFLMAGVATDYTEIGLIWNNIGKKTAVWLPLVAVPQIILFGVIANIIF
ncbi:MAG: permease [Candidatus Omnitrophica bacterium]|nr:permease [Candidatus Omnitrophota bacterium]